MSTLDKNAPCPICGKFSDDTDIGSVAYMFGFEEGRKVISSGASSATESANRASDFETPDTVAMRSRKSDAPVLEDLRKMVESLALALAKASPSSAMPEDALGYLRSAGLTAAIVRQPSDGTAKSRAGA